MNNINVKTLNVNKEKFFIYWLEFLKPYHKLRDKEVELLGKFLTKRHELLKKVNDNSIVDDMLFDTKIKKDIQKEMNYSTLQVLNNMMTSLRNKGAIVDNKINKGLIPSYDESHDSFKLIFNFVIKE